MTALYEAIVLVVLVAWLGFWEWRSALLIALSIPITLAMTFGMMYVLGIDLQQVSIATLIIALGLLVDDPVVAGDAIKHELGMGRPATVAAWLGPTKLARAILFATITNIVAYLPFLMISGDTGEFLYSLPIVMTCALVASRIVSMTFIPQLGYYLMRPGKPLPPIEYRRTHGVTGVYYKLGHYALEHRKVFVACSFLFLAGGIVDRHASAQRVLSRGCSVPRLRRCLAAQWRGDLRYQYGCRRGRGGRSATPPRIMAASIPAETASRARF